MYDKTPQEALKLATIAFEATLELDHVADATQLRGVINMRKAVAAELVALAALADPTYGPALATIVEHLAHLDRLRHVYENTDASRLINDALYPAAF